MESTMLPDNTSSADLITLQEAAASTRGSKKWVRKQIKLGHLVAYRLGGKILIRQQDLIEFIAKQVMAPQTEGGR